MVKKLFKNKQSSDAMNFTSPDGFKTLIRSTALRVGVPILILWVIAILIGHPYVLIGAGVLTVLALALVGWAYWYLRKSRAVAGILQGTDMTSKAGRQKALDQLESKAGKGDATALFAKAQVLMHENPQQALEVLEQINLNKVVSTVADEARGQRAMIHLMMGDVSAARVLVDGIDLSRHKQTATRAALAAVVAEAWARSGQAKRANETLDLFDPNDEQLEPLRPQLYRARAFAAAATNDSKRMRFALKKLVQINPQLLGGFTQKKVHPLLERHAKQILLQSGAVPKKIIRKRI